MEDLNPLPASSDWVEVRLLGPLGVRSADGTLISDRDWRTGKNADLVRWLALEVGRPVGVEALLEGLWPGAEESRARASLRTAVSHLRRLLGHHVIERSGSDVVMHQAWVDAGTFLDMARHVARRRGEESPASLFATAREADALYLADVPVVEGTPQSIVHHSETLAAAHRRLLGDAAELAIELGWMRDAVDYAQRLLHHDPVSELASRALMLGYAGMGELHHALREYERCREALADELGVDPSPQTRAVHLRVLQQQAEVRRPSAPRLVGREAELEWLLATLEETRRGSEGDHPGHGTVVVLLGPSGSGRRRVAAMAGRRAGVDVQRVSSGADLFAAVAAGAPVVVWRPERSADAAAVRRLLEQPDAVGRGCLVILGAPAPGEDPVWDDLRPGPHVRKLVVPPLQPEHVAEMAGQMLGGPVSAALVDALVAESQGLPAVVERTLHRWAGSGRLVATEAGLTLAPVAAVGEEDPWGRGTLVRTLPRLEGDPLEALLLAALIEDPMTPSMLAPLLPDGSGEGGVHARARATSALEKLVDLALLRSSPGGAAWRHPKLQDAVRAWLRPSARQRLHRRIAERAFIPAAQRIEHWVKAGEPELACVAALEAAAESTARGDHAGARRHLLEVCSLGELREAAATDRVDLFERLGDACALLRQPEGARDAYSKALDIALSDGLADAGRLRRKLEGLTDPTTLDPAPGRPVPGTSVLAGRTAPPVSPANEVAEALLRDDITRADGNHDRRAGFHARLQLAGSFLLPRREFRAVHQCLQEAMSLGARREERWLVTLVASIGPVLLGSARTAQTQLQDAARAAADLGEDRLGWRVLGLRTVAAHDLGDPSFTGLWSRLQERVLAGAVDETVPELAALALRILVEREELDHALVMEQHLAFASGPANLIVEHVARVARAELAVAHGDSRHGLDLLQSVIDDGMRHRCLLLVPEAAAQLAMLAAESDPTEARAAFEVFDEILASGYGGPREEFLRRMARGAVRAGRGDHQGAAHAYGQAGALAGQHGLQVLAARARRARAMQVRLELPHSVASVPGLAGFADRDGTPPGS